MARNDVRAPRVLIVEDEPALMGAFSRHLEQLGFEVAQATSIQQARAAAWEQLPDVVLLDVLLPDGSGYDFCAELRRITSAPIIYVTALGQDAAVVRGLAAGGDVSPVTERGTQPLARADVLAGDGQQVGGAHGVEQRRLRVEEGRKGLADREKELRAERGGGVERSHGGSLVQRVKGRAG